MDFLSTHKDPERNHSGSRWDPARRNAQAPEVGARLAHGPRPARAVRQPGAPSRASHDAELRSLAPVAGSQYTNRGHETERTLGAKWSVFSLVENW